MKSSFFKYVGLNIFGALSLSGCILADTLFVANRLGAQGLAALNLAIPVFGLLNGLGVLLGVGGATRYSICRHGGREGEARRAFTLAALCAGGVGLLLALAGTLWAGPLAALLGAEGAALPLSASYLRVVLTFSPCFLLNHVLTAFVRNDGNPRLAMAAMLSGSLSNIALDWLFLYPMGWGIAGAALATGLAPAIGLAVNARHLRSKSSGLRPARPALRPRALAAMAGLGGSAFLVECSAGVVLLVYNRLLLSLSGELGVAAYGIVGNLALMALALFSGIAQGVQPLVSRAHGRGNGAEAGALCRRALLLAGGAGLALAVGALWLAGPLVDLFNRDGGEALRLLAERGLRLYFPGFLFAGLNLVAAALLAAAERPRAALTISLLRGMAGVTAAAVLFAALFGVDGVWLAFPAVEGAVLLLSLRCSRTLRRGAAPAAVRA